MEGGKKRKKTAEEIRAYNRERQRERRKKFTEEQLAAKREYDKKYKEKRKKVADLAPREARKIRRQTRQRTRRCREKKKREEATNLNVPENISLDKKGPSRKEAGRKKKVLSRTKVYLDLIKAKKREDNERRLKERYKKRYQRLLKHIKGMSTPSPNSKVKSICGNVKVPTPVKRKLIFSEILTSHLQKKKEELTKNQGKLREFSKIVSPIELKKNKMIGEASSIVSYKQYKKSIENQGRKKSLKNVDNAALVRGFLELDINSRMCPGKKEYITKHKVKRQKRILLDSLKNLHLKFLREHGIKMCYSTFRKLKPFHIVPPKHSDRETCLCMDHANMQLLVDKLYFLKILPSNSLPKLAEMACCSVKQKSCMYRQCAKCTTKLTLDLTNKDLSQLTMYRQWVKKTEERTIKKQEKTVKLTVKGTLESSLHDLIDLFWQKFNKITPHMFDINHQFKEMKHLKDTLREKEVVVHMDFSENYCTKYAAEPQSLHFGASKKQLSLHTIVCYYKPLFSETNTVQSYCTLSSNLDHAAHGVWAHLEPVLRDILDSNPLIDSIHFQSDGPSSQYKNRNNLYFLIHKLPQILPNLQRWTWNYSVSGHGKGPMEGIGGTIKRTADSLVLHGEDVVSTADLICKVGPLCPKVQLIEVQSENFEQWKSKLPDKVPGLKGIQKAHQILWQKKKPLEIEMRKLSCVKCGFKLCNHFGLGLKSYQEASKVSITKLKPKRNPKPKYIPKHKSKPGPNPKSKSKPKPKLKSKPQFTDEIKPNAKATDEIRPIPKPKSVQKHKLKPEPNPETKPISKPKPMTEVTDKIQPIPKAKPKSAPKHKSKSEANLKTRPTGEIQPMTTDEIQHTDEQSLQTVDIPSAKPGFTKSEKIELFKPKTRPTNDIQPMTTDEIQDTDDQSLQTVDIPTAKPASTKSEEIELCALKTFKGKKPLPKNPRGLCFACGGNFKKCDSELRAIECDLCDKIFHLKCGPLQSGSDIFDQIDPIFVCKPCNMAFV